MIGGEFADDGHIVWRASWWWKTNVKSYSTTKSKAPSVG